MNLAQMRYLVRTQLDLDETDLPDTLLDAYLQQGYDLAVGLEQRWPFFESMWQINITSAGITAMPIDVRVIELLTYAGRILRRVDHRWAVGAFGTGDTTTGNPAYWTTLGAQLRVWPAASSVSTLTASGYRMGADWIAGGAASECDCDRRLHIPICWYACSLGYAQQEDEVLEATYLNRFKETAMQARDAIMRTWPGSPKQVSYTHYPSAGELWARQPQLVFALPGP